MYLPSHRSGFDIQFINFGFLVGQGFLGRFPFLNQIAGGTTELRLSVSAQPDLLQ
jgi:hypothetical protein